MPPAPLPPPPPLRAAQAIPTSDEAGYSDAWCGRIVRDSDPPRIDLVFRIESAQGAVLKEGERQLRDSNFLNRPRHRSEALGYEKNLIDDWLRTDVEPAKR